MLLKINFENLTPSGRPPTAQFTFGRPRRHDRRQRAVARAGRRTTSRRRHLATVNIFASVFTNFEKYIPFPSSTAPLGTGQPPPGSWAARRNQPLQR